MRNATIRQLRALSALARTGSVTRAAELLHLTPPAVTLQLQALQQEAGVKLLDRGPSGMVLTDAGREVAAAAQRIDGVLSECEAVLGDLAGARRGTVGAGITSTAKYFAPRALGAFSRRHPGLDLRLSVGNRAETIQGLRDHSIDLAVMGQPPDELPVEATVIGPHPHVVVTAQDHPLVGRQRISPEALEAELFLVREQGSGTRSLMQRFFADAGVAPRIGMELGSNETIKQAVLAGLGIAFLSAHTIELEVQTRRLAILDVVGLPAMRQWYAVHVTDRRLTLAARALHTFLVTEGAQYLPDLCGDLPASLPVL
jgi:LysR family transcriptional regulator for metE and metH